MALNAMRLNEKGIECPSTLGEYKAVCKAIANIADIKHSKAMKFLEDKIAVSSEGENTVVLAEDSQMRRLLAPLLLEEVDG